MSGPMQWRQGVGLVPLDSAQPTQAIDLSAFGEASVMPAVVPPPSAHVAPKKAKAPAPKNVVSLARARLKEAKKELRRLKRVEQEVAELERLIEAAENKPKADKRILREVKSNAG